MVLFSVLGFVLGRGTFSRCQRLFYSIAHCAAAGVAPADVVKRMWNRPLFMCSVVKARRGECVIRDALVKRFAQNFRSTRGNLDEISSKNQNYQTKKANFYNYRLFHKFHKRLDGSERGGSANGYGWSNASVVNRGFPSRSRLAAKSATGRGKPARLGGALQPGVIDCARACEPDATSGSREDPKRPLPQGNQVHRRTRRPDRFQGSRFGGRGPSQRTLIWEAGKPAPAP